MTDSQANRRRLLGMAAIHMPSPYHVCHSAPTPFRAPTAPQGSMNLRKPAILTLLQVTGSGVPGELALIGRIERSAERIAEVQRTRLAELLRHAWAQVPYYRDTLESCGAVRDGRVDLDRFADIPFLTKEVIRAEGDRLRAKALPGGRRAFRTHPAAPRASPCGSGRTAATGTRRLPYEPTTSRPSASNWANGR